MQIECSMLLATVRRCERSTELLIDDYLVGHDDTRCCHQRSEYDRIDIDAVIKS